jgi:outer membrane biosynthesis protein TonB
MKPIIFLLAIVSPSLSSFAQEVKKDSTFCSCSYKVQVSYPNVAEEDELEGTVIVEYEVDSLCFASNPRIIQSLGPAYDKEALRAVNLWISFNNKCISKCKFGSCEKRKRRFPLTFKKTEDQD